MEEVRLPPKILKILEGNILGLPLRISLVVHQNLLGQGKDHFLLKDSKPSHQE